MEDYYILNEEDKESTGDNEEYLVEQNEENSDLNIITKVIEE